MHFYYLLHIGGKDKITKAMELPTLRLGKVLREKAFDLDENVAFCNSGSYSCVPLRFIDRQTELVREREKNSCMWAFETESKLIWKSLEMLAKFVGAKIDNITFIDNTSIGTNAILKSLKYSAGDKILLCRGHSYPAVVKQVEFLIQYNPGVELIMVDIPFPIKSKDDIIGAYSKTLTEHPDIKIAVIDHISSDTAILFPVKELIDLCRQHDVISVIDGAHTAGQLKLTIEDYGADFYVGNLCKWMMVPEQAGFLWVHPRHHDVIQPLMTSHTSFDTNFRDRFFPPNTKCRISYILAKDAIEFYEELGGLEAINERNTKLVTEAAAMLSEAWGTPQLEVVKGLRAPQMAIIGFPQKLKDSYANHTYIDLAYDVLLNGACVRVSNIEGEKWCRICSNVWNDWDDYERLRDVVAAITENNKIYPGQGIRPKYFVPHSDWNNQE